MVSCTVGDFTSASLPYTKDANSSFRPGARKSVIVITPVVPCAEVVADTSEYRVDIGDDATVMMRKFTITRQREDVVTLKQLKAFVWGKDMTVTVAKDRLKRMGAKRRSQLLCKRLPYGEGLDGCEIQHLQ